ncbi:MAG: DUF1611 domain-containing protein [Thermoplasmatota archaeon]
MARIAILAHDAFDPTHAKTGHALLRYARAGWSGDEVVAVIDRAQAGKDASAAVGPIGSGIPIVASVAEARAKRPDVLAIGIAPVGGALPGEWRTEIADALRAKWKVVSGLHTFLAEDPEFASLAGPAGDRIWDVRRWPRERYRIATGQAALVDAVVVTLVGTDCSSGKMTTAIELTREARRRGIEAGFVATGQTGLMVGADSGAPLDAIPSDFVAGAMEEAVVAAANQGREILFVEGQASIAHPAYSGVSLSLLHGSFPDLLVLCGEPARRVLRFKSAIPFPTNPFPMEGALNEAVCGPRTGARVAAVALMTPGRSAAEYEAEVARTETEMHVSAGDVFRGDAGRILDGVLRAAEAKGLWRDGRYVGAKSKRTPGSAVSVAHAVPAATPVPLAPRRPSIPAVDMGRGGA